MPRRRGRLILAAAAAVIGAGCSYPKLIDEGKVDEAYLQRVIDRTSQARSIPLDSPIAWQLLTEEQQKARIHAAIAEVTTEVETELAVWRAFGLVDESFDLAAVSKLYADQVAAHYDPATKTFYLVDREPTAGMGFVSWALERDLEGEFVACHEIVHALQDPKHDLTTYMLVEGNGDAALARRAVVEGDATYHGLVAMLAGLVQPWDIDALEIDPALLEDDLGDLEDAPPVLVETLLFPYLGGLRLMQQLGPLSRDGPWTRPPRSTEQVLHPDKYTSDEAPVAIQLAQGGELPAGWTLVAEDTLGELGVGLVLRARDAELERDEAMRAACGWGGDRYRVYRGPQGALALVWALRFDHPAAAQVFVQAYRARAPGPASLCALHGDRGVVVVEAPDGAVLAAIAPAALQHTAD